MVVFNRHAGMTNNRFSKICDTIGLQIRLIF